MNQDTTSLIEQKAKEYSRDKWSFEHEDLHKRLRVTTSQTDFTAGASFALSCPELYRGLLVDVLEWYDNSALGASHAGNGEWYDNEGTKRYTTEELVTIFINKQESNENTSADQGKL